MSFDVAWLDLREPADHAARDGELLTRARRYVSAIGDPLVVDLGAGTGSSVRAFQLPGTRWRLIDRDETLLDVARHRCGPIAETVSLDLRDVETIPLDGARLVTASALFDLVGDDWMERFVSRLAEARVGLYAALTYDGAMSWTPGDPEDAPVAALFNRHQRTDKGFGPALGPRAAEALLRVLGVHGYRTLAAASPWRLDGNEVALQRALLGGIAAAAGEVGHASAEDWLRRRLDMAAGSRCDIGHVDILALPAE